MYTVIPIIGRGNTGFPAGAKHGKVFNQNVDEKEEGDMEEDEEEEEEEEEEEYREEAGRSRARKSDAHSERLSGKVALKFMRFEADYLRELLPRRRYRLDPKYIVPVIACYRDGGRDDFLQPKEYFNGNRNGRSSSTGIAKEFVTSLLTSGKEGKVNNQYGTDGMSSTRSHTSRKYNISKLGICSIKLENVFKTLFSDFDSVTIKDIESLYCIVMPLGDTSLASFIEDAMPIRIDPPRSLPAPSTPPYYSASSPPTSVTAEKATTPSIPVFDIDRKELEYVHFHREIQDILSNVAVCMSHLHSQGLVYSNLDLTNVIKVGRLWKLVDLDLCCPIGGNYSFASNLSPYADPGTK